MLPSRRGGVAVARVLFLSFLAASGVPAQFTVENGSLSRDGRPLVVRGAVYSGVSIGADPRSRFDGASCRYARDFPLLASAGANTVRTLARLDPGDPSFVDALDAANLYWLAGFPLDAYFSPARSLSGAGGQGQELRRLIVDDFLAWAQAWSNEPRLIGFVFGNDATRDYASKFAGSPVHFYSLATEAAAALRASGSSKLITISLTDPRRIGGVGTTDSDLGAIDFLSLDLSGRGAVGSAVRDALARTAKPLLVSAYGVDAFDVGQGGEDEALQGRLARAAAEEIEGLAESESVLGGLWASLADEWWRESDDPSVQRAAGVPAPHSPDGTLNASWLGLFRVERSGLAGLDTLRPRQSYFDLAQAWGGASSGTVFEEFSMAEPPRIETDGVRTTGTSFGFLSRGSLATVRGEHLAFSARQTGSAAKLPPGLGPVSLCIGRRPAPLYYADEVEIRGQVPWDAPAPSADAVVFRAGVASNRLTVPMLAATPSIFPNGVMRPDRPCPVNVDNGVRPGSELQIYGTGLGPGTAALATGASSRQAAPTITSPQAWLNGRSIPVLRSMLFPGVAGVYQTDLLVPADTPLGPAELRLLQGGIFSNGHEFQILAAFEAESYLASGPQPGVAIVQAGGPPQTLEVSLTGINGFCDRIEFQFAGLPPGVHASVPRAMPGQTLPLRIWADPEAPQVENVPVALVTISPQGPRPAGELRVSVLPSRGAMAVRAVSGGWLSPEPVARFEVEGRTLYEVFGGGPGRGFNFFTIDPTSGAIGPIRRFDTWASDAAVGALERYLRGLPDGVVVAGAIADDGFLKLTQETLDLIEDALGSESILDLEYQGSWAIVTRKGGAPFAESLAVGEFADVSTTLSFPLP